MPEIPIEKQRRIAAILDTADATIRQTGAVIAKLKQVKAGLLHDLLTRGLDAHGRLRDPDAHPEQFKETAIGRVPREWGLTSLGDLGTWHGGSTPSKSNPANWADGNILWLTPKDMRQAEILDTEDKVTAVAVSNGRLRLFPSNHVAVVFRSGILRHSLPVAISRTPFTVNQDMKVLSPAANIEAEFAFWLLSGLSYDIRNSTMKSGTTVESIDTQAFMNYRVSVPDLDEQRRITEIFKSHNARIRSEEAYRDKLQKVKKALMQDLLTGRVRV